MGRVWDPKVRFGTRKSIGLKPNSSVAKRLYNKVTHIDIEPKNGNLINVDLCRC